MTTQQNVDTRQATATTKAAAGPNHVLKPRFFPFTYRFWVEGNIDVESMRKVISIPRVPYPA